MDPLKNIKFDVNRILLQLFIPGIFAAVPFFLIAINGNDSCREYFSKSEGMSTTILIILALTIGLILEDLGSLIEYWFDKKNKNKYSKKITESPPSTPRDTDEEWKKYLQLQSSEETDRIAQKYLRTILVRLKFEISFCVSLFLMVIGLIILNIQICFIAIFWKFLIVCLVIPLSVAAYLFWEAKNSTELLIKVRKWILEVEDKK